MRNNSFADAFKLAATFKTTENGAQALRTTGSALLDLYGAIGAMRSRSNADIIRMFSDAFSEDRVLATKLLFHCRDIRNGGMGERRAFRVILKWLANEWPEFVRMNIDAIPVFGRFDDLLILFDTKSEREMIDYVRKTLSEDMMLMEFAKSVGHKPKISLISKWLPSEGASSATTRNYARRMASALGLSASNYRRMLSDMRAHLRVIERDITKGAFDSISYSGVPSLAMKRYKKLFKTKDTDRFAEYIRNVKSGKEKINASVLFPHDIVYEILYNGGGDDVAQAQWDALPNYLPHGENAIVMADVSGSMEGKPMAASVGLATYFAQRNTGPFHGLYMTYTSNPRFIHIKDGQGIRDIVGYVRDEGVGYSTNLSAAFDSVLHLAKVNQIPQEEMPKAFIVVSDMEIDEYMRYPKSTDFLSEKERMFLANGYELPKVVFWNVDARNNTYHSTKHHPKVQFASGYSAGVFKGLIANLDKSAYDAMVAVLNSKVYNVLRFPS